MKSRRSAREAALQALYQCDTLDDWSDECIALYFAMFQDPLAEQGSSPSDLERANRGFSILRTLDCRSRE
jgi:hypothetical protein